MIIYKGNDINHGWTRTVDEAEALFAHSNKRFISGDRKLEWLHRFDTWTSIHTAGAPRFLLMDGRCTHYSLQFISVAHYALSRTLATPTVDSRCLFTAPLQPAYSSAVATHICTTDIENKDIRFAILARSDLGKAAAVAGESSKSAKQKGKEVLYSYDLRIFSYFNDRHRSPLW